ncbi:pirin family protein [Corynebacterium sp. H130]|uniref:pirin family protein n=1 Tax=Corynebacterium sp. H130 TaxID=3133444 RepID=UPI00309B7549
MDVPPHPHTGLQTVSWLFDGHITHHDSGDNHAVVRPGELNIMTAGAGFCHSEVSTSNSEVLHGVQLWTVLPDSARFTKRRFEHYAPEPVSFNGGEALVFLGSLLGSDSPVETYSPLVGAEIRLGPGAPLSIPVSETFEHGILVDAGDVSLNGSGVSPSELAYFAPGEAQIEIRNDSPTKSRVLLIGGAPFEEEFIMWWNFIGRTHEEIARFREEWESGDARFGQVDGYIGRTPGAATRLPAPKLPPIKLKPRK